MEQRLIPIHLCPQCGSSNIYTFLDDECPNCNYKFGKNESYNMISHCPYCQGNEITIRIKPYWGESTNNPASDRIYETLRARLQGCYTEFVERHITYKSLCDQFERFAPNSIFELSCTQCRKELCKDGTNFVLLMKSNENQALAISQDQEKTSESINPTSYERACEGLKSRKGCSFIAAFCFIFAVGSIISGVIVG